MSGDSTGWPSLSMAMGLSPTRHNLLYLFKTGSCNYTSKITDDISVTWVIKPLIDKIKPTIKIEANIGGYHRILVDQENNTSTSNFPFLAGTNGVITLSLVDSWSSNYTSNIFLGWQSFSGVSGMSNYTIKITHIKDYKGDTISPSITPLVDNGFTLSGASYNPNGSITIPHSLTQSGWTSSDAFTVAGTYWIEVAVLDAAGNLSTVDTTFVVHSTSIPSSDPCISPSPPAYCSQVLFCKANPTHPSCLDPTTTPSTTTLLKIDNTRTYTWWAIVSSGSVIYTINGTNTSVVPWPATPTDAYANASDNNLYMIHISDSLGNPVYNWNLYDFQLSGTGIYLDSVNKTWSSAIWVDAGNGYTYWPQTVQTDINGNVFFRLLSYTPWQYTEQFTYKYYQPKIDISNNRVEDTSSLFTSNFPLVSLAQTGQFLHILTGAIDLYTNNRIDLGTSNNVCLDFYTTTSTTTNTLTGFTVSNFLESITSLSPSGTIPSPDFHVTQTGSYLSTISFSSKYPTPSYLSGAVGVFTPEQIGALFTGSLSIETWPYITMTFGDPIQTTKYYITASKSDYGSGIIFGTGRLNRIYIEWLRSTIGKDGYVDAGGSATSSNSADTRNAVHKNVATLIRNRLVWWWIINRVKYLTGNVNSTDLTDITPWDTLIIKGWDLTIGDSSFNVSAATTSLKEIPHKGIIVLQDDNGVGGNIYIKPDVHFIGATLFADESIQSVNDAGALFSKSNSDRTFLLNKQLIIYGGIFSKNTVGGAVRADSNGNYVLPWKNTTSSLDEAVQYDLAFLRMDNLGFNSANSFMSQGHDEYVVILTDPRNLSSPLPWFVVNLQ